MKFSIEQLRFGTSFGLLLITFVCLVFLISGCAVPKPKGYCEFGLGAQVTNASDWYVRNERSWQCSENIKAIAECGFETKGGWRYFYNHQSWLPCGEPFGDGKPELYEDHIGIKRKFGGY